MNVIWFIAGCAFGTLLSYVPESVVVIITVVLIIGIQIGSVWTTGAINSYESERVPEQQEKMNKRMAVVLMFVIMAAFAGERWLVLALN